MLIPMSIVMEPDDLVPFNEVVWHTHTHDWLLEHDLYADGDTAVVYDGDSNQDPEVPTPPTPHPGPPQPGDPIGNPPTPGDPAPQPPSPGGPGPVNPNAGEPVAY